MFVRDWCLISKIAIFQNCRHSTPHVYLVMLMEAQEKLLLDLRSNVLDRVEIKFNLHKFKADFNESAPLAVLKYQLQLLVIENLKRQADSCSKNTLYSQLKQETTDLLSYYISIDAKRTFKCCLAGCLFRCSKYRFYIRHLKISHPRSKRLVCQYGYNCELVFTSVDLLIQHVKTKHGKCDNAECQENSFHASEQLLSTNVSCKCIKLKCSGIEFPNAKKLMRHMINFHTKQGDQVECIFMNCLMKFTNPLSLKSHFLLKHKKVGKVDLKSQFIVNAVWQDTNTNINAAIENHSEVDTGSFLTDEADTADMSLDFSESYDDDDFDFVKEKEFMHMAYCDFLNRLYNFQFVPQSTLKIISEEYLKHYKKSNDIKEKAVRRSLEIVQCLSTDQISRVMDEFNKQDPFLEAQVDLGTAYKWKQFLVENFTHVEYIFIMVRNCRSICDELLLFV